MDLTQYLFITLIFCLQLKFNHAINEGCIDSASGQNGICRYLKDCPDILGTWKYFDQPNRPTICNVENNKVIVCCPTQFKPKINITVGFVKFHDICLMPITGELGRIKQEKHCSIENYQQSLTRIKLHRACPYEICYDMICCQSSVGPRLRQECKHESVNKLITTRLRGNFVCIVPSTNIFGRYTNKGSCSFYKESLDKNQPLPRVCDWKDCEDYVCCPETHLNNTLCAKSTDNVFDYIELNGGHCTIKDSGKPGICTASKYIPARFRIDEYKCGTDCCEDFYCNPLPEIGKFSASESACSHYSQDVFEENKIVRFINPEIDRQRVCFTSEYKSNKIAEPKEYPHIAVLGYPFNNQINWGCTGSLISASFILTAAYCLESSIGLVEYVRLGITDLNQTKYSEDCPVEFLVLNRIAHPDYSMELSYNDIGLIQLNGVVQFSPIIRPICLPTSQEIPNDLITIDFRHDKYYSYVLTQTQVKYLDHKECNELDFNRNSSGLDKQILFCAGTDGSNEDTLCSSILNFGSPIQSDHQDFYKINIIYGVTSKFEACNTSNRSKLRYTSVYPYVSWIESIVWSKL